MERENWVIKAAFDLIRVNGFDAAKRIAAEQRDSNSAGTASFAMHNQVFQQVCEFCDSGSAFYPCN